MSNYYALIDGKRYSASLINNAIFRTRGVGDGRISVQDAQDLWQLAKDGGRITEIEEDTTAYLLAEFNWTDAAKAWLEKEMSLEVEKIKSYYRIIDGLRYDRKILEEADRRVARQGDGRISVDDAEMLLPLSGDFGDVTIVEERTLAGKYSQAARLFKFTNIEAINKLQMCIMFLFKLVAVRLWDLRPLQQ